MIDLEKQYCDQCEKQCPTDALQCGRGRRRFGLEKPDETGGKPSGVIGLLRQCGHLLHHGGVSGEDLLSCLNAKEQAELERLLGTLLADWSARMSANAEDPHHRGMSRGNHHGR